MTRDGNSGSWDWWTGSAQHPVQDCDQSSRREYRQGLGMPTGRLRDTRITMPLGLTPYCGWRGVDKAVAGAAQCSVSFGAIGGLS